MGGSSPSPPPPPPAPEKAPGSGAANYIPNNQPGIDTAYNDLFTQLQTGANGLVDFGIPAIYNYANNIQNNPYSANALSGAIQGSDFATNQQIPQLQGAANNLTGAAQSTLPYANQALQAGFDPQNALYNRTQQQVQDQANAINAMYGLSSSPYGAGVANQAMSNFNIDWQNQQLARQGQGAQTAGNIAQTAAGEYGAGLGYLGQIPGTMTGASVIPYSTYNTLQSQPMSAISNAANVAQQLYNPTTAAMGSALGYLGTGINASAAFNNAQNANYANQLAGYGLSANQYNSNLAGIGSGLGGAFDVASNPLSMFGVSLW
jgi:hypothetical protein